MMKRLILWAASLLLAMSCQISYAADVLLGAGDVVRVSVYGSPDLLTETRVSEAGKITFPLIGQVELNGLTVAAAEQKIASMLEKGGYLRRAQVNILVTVMSSQQVSVLGQVNRPGRYPIDGQRGMLDMLAQAGGIAADGGDAAVLIRTRNGKTTKEVVDVIDLVRSADVTRDLSLAGGDVIYVERAPRAYIYGEVQRPGPFRLERSMTVLQALSTGGGLTARGTERNMRIKRRDVSGKIQVIEAKQDDLILVDDVVYVQESLF